MPPLAVAVKVTEEPTVPVAGPLTVAASASGLMTIVAVAIACQRHSQMTTGVVW